ncbi:hypothetical protein V9T40_011415 [Parthenolecanium corni]|uniref:SOCS box domain-containing protein n=1 Tax=Parthenolecanium corni TaxID=536013 RepID=A0AAN9T8Y0_9HEMI
MLDSLFQALQENDQYAFLQILEIYQHNPSLQASHTRKWAELYFTTASKPKFKGFLELLFRYAVHRKFFQKDDQTKEGLTALHIACENGCDENVLVLLQRDCDPNIKTNTGETALHIACSKGYVKIVKHLLDHFAYVDEQNNDGYKPLHLACKNGSEENVLMILQNGYIPNSRGGAWEMALHVAYSEGHLKIVEHLLNYGGVIYERDRDGNTPLHIAVMFNEIEKVRILLEKPANLQLPNECGQTPLHKASHLNDGNSSVEIAARLLERDTYTINYQDDNGCTPLMDAVRVGNNLPYIKYLLERGAKTEFRNKQGQTTLHLAIENHIDTETVALVLKKTDTKWIEQCLLNSPITIEKPTENTFHPLLDKVIYYSVTEVLSVLLSSTLPKSVLQIPILVEDDGKTVIYSPLTYLFYVFKMKKETEKFETGLHLLLKHKITTLDEFNRAIRVDWSHFWYSHPFSFIFSDSYFSSKRDYFLSLLNDNNVTADYCLQCYHDNTEPFYSFHAYENYYEPLMDVLRNNNLEKLKFMLSNSAIVEPDKLLFNYFHLTSVTYCSDDRKCFRYKDYNKAYGIYQYLISLKPMYYRQIGCHKFNLPTSFSNDTKSYRNIVRNLKTKSKEHPPSFIVSKEFWNAISKEHSSFFSISEEFSKVTLQQLCRTVIRQHLRGPTLEDNLCNFKKNISELPLPNVLKDYLSFKN